MTLFFQSCCRNLAMYVFVVVCMYNNQDQPRGWLWVACGEPWWWGLWGQWRVVPNLVLWQLCLDHMCSQLVVLDATQDLNQWFSACTVKKILGDHIQSEYPYDETSGGVPLVDHLWEVYVANEGHTNLRVQLKWHGTKWWLWKHVCVSPSFPFPHRHMLPGRNFEDTTEVETPAVVDDGDHDDEMQAKYISLPIWHEHTPTYKKIVLTLSWEKQKCSALIVTHYIHLRIYVFPLRICLFWFVNIHYLSLYLRSIYQLSETWLKWILLSRPKIYSGNFQAGLSLPEHPPGFA